MKPIQMVDLQGQYAHIKEEIDAAVGNVLAEARYINGPAVSDFASALAAYTGAAHVVTCASGTDALYLALRALDLQPGDEVVTVPFTFVSTIEVIAMLGLKPVLVDVTPDTFCMDVSKIENVITPRTKAILPVHLFGQCADMEHIIAIARAHNLYVVEDACQAIGAEVTFSDGTVHQAGTMGDVGCTSFFPSKNLGCFGDGGAVFTQTDALAAKIRSMANHGMSEKYYYECVGLNSRLDTLQAAILQVKLRHLGEYIAARQDAAARYNTALQNVAYLQTPTLASYSTHVYHQYTLRILDGSRKARTEQLSAHDIPYAIYYPLPLHLQQAYRHRGYSEGAFPVSEMLSRQVLSLPMHTELTEEQIHHIASVLAVGY